MSTGQNSTWPDETACGLDNELATMFSSGSSTTSRKTVSST